MKNLNVALIRVLQFVVFALFTFMVLVYFGTLILLPLDIVVMLSKVLGGSIFSVILAVPAVAFLGKVVYNTPGLIQMLIDNGIDLVNMGKERVEAFNKLAEAAK
jgi:hypothetical protein